ncbi:hypothetical protein PSR1_02175 [Anaeromyxobacter sp. PSR-1]|nr:hypothetical protein PSR1_02175 [Anaeromyxobacter sp. PSR-1]
MRVAIPALLLLTVSTSCGRGPDLVVHQTAVVLDTTAPFAHHPDFARRLESTMSAALEYWGGDWKVLAHRTVTFQDEQFVACGGMGTALGCFDGDIRLTTRDPSIGTFRCVEATVLVHEIGHAVIGDRDHRDPRWMDFERVAQELAGRIGYPDGSAPCELYPSVWRHVPGS